MAIQSEDLNWPRPAPAPAQGVARRSRLRALLFLLVALIAGVGAAWLITRYLSQRADAAAQAQLTQVAVAATDVPLGTPIRAELIKFVPWPTQAVPAGSFTTTEPLIGRVVAKDFSEGEPFVEARIATTAAGLGMAALVPSDLRAMTVRVNEVSGVSGFIHPNDVVDVITTMRTDLPGEKQDFRSKIVLQKVKVLAVGQQVDTQSEKPVKVPVVTLLVTPEQSERLALASTQGKIQLTLRARSDGLEVATEGVSPPELFGTMLVSKQPAAPAARAVPQQVVRVKKDAPPAPTTDVVEVLRGDRYEERKLRTKDGQP